MSTTTTTTTVSIVADADLAELRYDIYAPRGGAMVCSLEDAGIALANALTQNGPGRAIRVREVLEDGRHHDEPLREVQASERLRRRARQLLALSRRLWRDAARTAAGNVNVG